MTVLEAPIETHPEVVLMSESDIASTPSAVGNVIMTGDHTVIGRLYVIAATIFGLFTLAIGSLLAFEQANLEGVSIFSGQEVYAAMFGLFRFSLLFLVVVPLMMGIATAVVPREVEAPSIAFPRAAAAALWTFVISGGIFIGATIYDGGIVDGADAQATELSILALGGIVLALCLASVCVLTTIIAQRREGMGLGDIPIFSWSMLVAGTMWLATLAVLLGNIALVWVDLRGLGTQFWEDGTGALRILGWVTDQTAIYVFAIPVLGVFASTALSAADNAKPNIGVKAGIAAFGVLAFGAYAQPVFNPNVTTQPVFVVQSMLMILPILVVMGGVAVAIMGTQPRVTVSLALAGGAVAMLGAGILTGGLRVFGHFVGGLRELDDWNWVENLAEPFDDLAGTAIRGGLFRFVALATLIAAIAGLYNWAPTILGRSLATPLGSLAGLAIVGGTFVAAVPEVINGFLDEPDILPTGNVRDGVELLNLISGVGLALVGVGLLILLLDLGMTSRRDDEIETTETMEAVA